MIFGFFTYPKRLNQLFCDAVHVWLLLGDGDALEVAASAIRTAAKKQRESMKEYARKVLQVYVQAYGEDGQIPISDSETIDLGKAKFRQSVMLQQFEEMQKWSLVKARAQMKRNNELAVQKAKVDYFRTRYPDFPLWGT